MKNRSWIIVIVVFLLLCFCVCIIMAGVGGYLYLAGSGSSVLNPSGSTTVDSLMINETDLPPGWDPSQHNYTFPYREGTEEGRNDVYEYYFPDDVLSSAYLSHEVWLYPSEEAAAAGYQSLYDEWLHPYSPAQVEFAFTPKNPADKADRVCNSEDTPGAYYCIFIQQHGRYATVLRTKIDGKALTVSQLDEILRRLDARLP